METNNQPLPPEPSPSGAPENKNQPEPPYSGYQYEFEKSEVHRRHARPRYRFNFPIGRILLGLFLIGVGFLYLAKIYNWIDFNFNINILQLWPLAVILIGISLLSGRGLFSGIFTVILVLVVVAAVIFLIFGNTLQNTPEEFQYIEPISINKNPDANLVILDINSGAGTLTLEGFSDIFSKILVSGSFESDFSKLNILSSLENNVQKVEISQKIAQNVSFSSRGSNLNLLANRDILLAKLTLNSGASDIVADLTDILIDETIIKTGASSVKVLVGERLKQSKLSISSGASSVQIILPRSVGAKVKINSGISTKIMVDFIQTGQGNYLSINYDEAQSHIDIELNLGVSSLNIGWK